MLVERAPFFVLPALHERVESAEVVRGIFAEVAPDAVVVEFPSSLERYWRRAVERLPEISFVTYDDSQGRGVYAAVQPADPFVEATRLAIERELPWRCGDLDLDGYGDYADAVPDAYAIARLGAQAYFERLCAAERPRDDRDVLRESSMAFHAQRLRAEGAAKILIVCGAHHLEGLLDELGREQATPLTPPVRRETRVIHPHPDTLADVLGELPFTIAAWEAQRSGVEAVEEEPLDTGKQAGPFRVLSGNRAEASTIEPIVARAAARAGTPFDRQKVHRALLLAAEEALRRTMPDEDVQPWHRRNLARYSRNLALASGRLLPDLFDLIVAARGCVSENFAYELLQLSRAYPAQREAATDVPTVRLDAEDVWSGTRRVRLRPLHRRAKSGSWDRLSRRRKQERFPGEWTTELDGDAICSYPPEDLVIEDFGLYLRKRGKAMLSEERSRTLPFSTSILDGIDVRETIRNWSEGRLYVKESGRAPGEVGAVVLVFDEDATRYPYEQTWLGEHDQESDMAFYSTDPTQAVVGPGICRVTYGGLMLTHPPRRTADVWTDPDYAIAESRAEVLLLAALDYAIEPIVVYAAARPPRAALMQLGARLGLKILFLPLGTLSPATLRKIRVMHILSGHEKRSIADEYIR